MELSELTPTAWGLLSLACFVVAFLYASVGHGGASGYLAVMVLFGLAPDEMASVALMLNIVVAGLACLTYTRSGCFSWRLTWPFLLASIPAAFLGGLMKLSDEVFQLLLIPALLFAAWRLVLPPVETAQSESIHPPLHWALPVGALIGWVSGMIGIGGGIFLSPVILLLGWATPKQTAATSACFIVVNASVGLLGRLMRGAVTTPDLLPLVAVGVVGSLLGANLGARRLTPLGLNRMLGVVLVVASLKLVMEWVSGA
jgi:uncharacterized membrane protein YfcA